MFVFTCIDGAWRGDKLLQIKQNAEEAMKMSEEKLSSEPNQLKFSLYNLVHVIVLVIQ